jgi:hypothetical protein
MPACHFFYLAVRHLRAPCSLPCCTTYAGHPVPVTAGGRERREGREEKGWKEEDVG